MAAQDNSRGLHPGQFAPMGGKLRLRLCKRIAHVRGGCTPGNSRLWVLVPSGDRPGPTEPAGETLASLVLIKALAHVRGDGYLPGKHAAWPRRTLRGGCTPGNSRRVAARDKSRLWQLASLVLIERIAHVRGGGIFRAKYGSEPGRQFQGRGAAGSIKQKEKRPWQTPLAFSL